MKDKVITIAGPTAVGKTEFAIRLAKRIGGEIISADSMQAYRSMDIVSQKPTPKQRRAVPHHLIDMLDPGEEYSAAEFAKRASALIEDIIKKSRIPLIVGGSGLYIKALIGGLFPSPKKDTDLRRRLEAEAKRFGKGRLHEKLKAVDPAAADSIHPNDLRRIVRALEVYHLTGFPISQQKKKAEGIQKRFNVKRFGLIRPRDIIYKRIEERVEEMFAAGLVKEVQRIKKGKMSITASASVGYKEVSGYLAGEYSLREAKGLLKKNTRHLAKKQLTWFRADKDIAWIDIEKISSKDAIEQIVKDISG
ncbi:MAG: tRNA (adenosine(37)-N6)-dimethylallyltransferase MiaA [Candidatus Omnitrophica bacterium]|nr:tRNA (adenosine(37)-N6)-dimethylallyltransferase MiaA [Candidatus Omnitrophota bacterium]